MALDVTKNLMGRTITLGDIDDIKVAGRYGFAMDGMYAGMTIMSACTLLDVHVVSDVVVQTIIKNPLATVPGTWKAIRSYVRGSWTPWEFDFPPMAAGVEYRTRENFKNKPVYAKLIDCGTCGYGDTHISTGIDATNVLIKYNKNTDFIYAVDIREITVKNTTAYDQTNIYVILYYVKT